MLAPSLGATSCTPPYACSFPPFPQSSEHPPPLLLPLPPAQFYADPLQRGAIGSVTVDGVARSWSWGAAKENVLKLTELNWSAAVRGPPTPSHALPSHLTCMWASNCNP